MAHPSMACVRLFDKNTSTYDFHKQIQDSQGVSALRSFVTSDSTALAVVSALVLTISVPLLLVREEDFVDQSADNTIFHFANTVFCTISIIASVCCITSGTFTMLHLMKVPDESLLDCISCIKGRFWNEPVLWCWVSFLGMIVGLSCNVLLLVGWVHSIICASISAPAVVWMWVVGDCMMHGAIQRQMAQKRLTNEQQLVDQQARG